MKETAIAVLLCNLLSGGETEIRHHFPNLGGTRHVRVDCETPSHVIEVGLDRSASLRDSVHQAVFNADLTGKTPMVIVIDRDGQEDRWEYELRVVARRLGIAFGSCKAGFIQRWNAIGGRFPPPPDYLQHCDLAGQFDPSGLSTLGAARLDRLPLLDAEEVTPARAVGAGLAPPRGPDPRPRAPGSAKLRH